MIGMDVVGESEVAMRSGAMWDRMREGMGEGGILWDETRWD